MTKTMIKSVKKMKFEKQRQLLIVILRKSCSQNFRILESISLDKRKKRLTLRIFRTASSSNLKVFPQEKASSGGRNEEFVFCLVILK